MKNQEEHIDIKRWKKITGKVTGFASINNIIHMGAAGYTTDIELHLSVQTDTTVEKIVFNGACTLQIGTIIDFYVDTKIIVEPHFWKKSIYGVREQLRPIERAIVIQEVTPEGTATYLCTDGLKEYGKSLPENIRSEYLKHKAVVDDE